MSTELDVVVVGAGGCGLAAAIAAHDAGVSTAILEKLDRPGGNSSLSTGSVPAAGSRFQREAGIDDSAERMEADLLAISGGTDEPELVRRLSEVSAETVEWLIDTVGARMQLITAYKHIGHTVQRLHAPISRRGQDLVDDLLAAVEKREIPLAVGNGVRDLIVDDGAVRGVVVENAAGGTERILAEKVILAVNGYAGNPDLVRRFCPEIAGASVFRRARIDRRSGAVGRTPRRRTVEHGGLPGLCGGRAIRMAACCRGPRSRRAAFWSITGRAASATKASAIRAMRATCWRRVEYCYALFDQRIFDIAKAEEEFVELFRYGGLKTGASPAEIAAAYGLDAAALSETVADYNAAAGGARTDAFGRRDFGQAPFAPPYYGCRVVPGLFHTQGGLKIDRDARVLKPDGTVVPNLFAGGGAAAGISGRAGALGYASGNGLLSAIGLGRLAGLAAGREVLERNS